MKSTITTKHEEIMAWAKARDGKPFLVKSSEDIEMLRIVFGGVGVNNQLRPISWDEFFAIFEKRQLGILLFDSTSCTNFNNLYAFAFRENGNIAPRPKRYLFKSPAAPYKTTRKLSQAKPLF